MTKFVIKTSSIKKGLPNLADAPAEIKELVEVGNKIVSGLPVPVKVTRRKGPYNVRSPESRYEIGKYAAEHGNTKAAKKFDVPESTARHLKKLYREKLKQASCSVDSEVLPHGNRGRPLMLGNLDVQVHTLLHKLREAGGVVNRNIVIAIATGVVKHYDPTLLVEHGGHVNVGPKYAESLLQRMGYVKRKGTKAGRKLPADYDQVKAAFMKRIVDAVQENKIPAELVINFDQTGVKLVPTSEWTMAAEGANQVEITGCDDKREITAVLGISMAGKMLPPQVIYAGKTDRCHPEFNFPSTWNITHSENHWSNEVTMLEYADQVLIPFCSKMRRSMNLPEDQKALAIFDVFAAHRCDSFIDKFQQANILITFVPAGCTGELQPLDVGVNNEFKQNMKAKFSEWYSSIIKNGLDKKKQIHEIQVELRTSTIKPKQARWLLAVINELGANVELVKSAWKRSGIYDIIQEVILNPTTAPDNNVPETATQRPGIFELMTAN